MFLSVLDSVTGNFTVQGVVICTAVSLVLGLLIAFSYILSDKQYSKSFVTTLALLPVLVQTVMMMVNGNLGTGVAVAGAFSLVRFRSVPGTSKEILAIFFAMAIGLSTGMGQVVFAGLITVIIAAVFLFLCKFVFSDGRGTKRTLRIIVPEDMDYENELTDIFTRYTKTAELNRVKTTNLGSLYELTYFITLEGGSSEKQLLDEIRQRNGNLTVSCNQFIATREEL